MKKILLYLSILFASNTVIAQSYYHTAGTQTTCKGQYFSSAGGPGAYGFSNGYANNQNVTETFCSATGGQIRANFYWVDLETGFDFLYIYDGPTTASPLIGTLTGSSYYPGVFTSSGTCLTFRFVSDGSTRWGGWQAFLGCTPLPCGTNSIASDDCGSAPVICNLDGYCGSTSGWYTRDHGNIEGSSWGGNNSFSCGSIQNNSWISFVASATTANFNITSSGCSDPSTGIQAVVFRHTACTTFTAVSACQSNGIGTFALNATGLTIGQTYYIMIDGVDGNDCNYVVQATGGVQTVKITAAGNTACIGSAFTLTATASGIGPFTYAWVPAPVSGQGTSVASYTASTSMTYSCIIGGACGSSQTATFYQPVNPSPTVTIAGTNSVCSAGPGTTLTANTTVGGNSISFSNNQDNNIPDNNATGITSTISVTGIAGTVGSALASVCLDITHGYDADLDITLKCPNGTVIILSDDNGGSGDNYTNTCFTNSGGSIVLGTAPFTGSFTPEQALSLLSGCTANGTWSLTVKDDAGLDVGTLLGWTLTFNNSISYSWSPGTSLSSTTSSVTVASPTATTVYSLTVTDLAGCPGTTQYTVTVNPTPTVAITSTPSSTLCLGSTLSFTAASANSYSWTSSANGGLTSTSGSIVAATPTVAGTYTYTVNGASTVGCQASDTHTITVNPVPVANAGTGGTLTCSTSSLALSGSGGGTYSWTGPGVVSGSTTATPVINASGTYSLVVTNTLGCTSGISTVSISQNTVVPIVTSSVSAVLNCTLTTVNVVATTTASPVSYTWSGTGISGGSGTSSASVTQPGTFNYTVTNTSNGCKATGAVAVTQNTTAPTLTVSGTQTITCAASSVTLTGAASPSTCTPVWTGGVSSGGTTYTATASSANTYTLTVTNPANGCFAANTVQVSPSAGFPSLGTPVISNSITCTAITAQAVVTSTTSNIVYSWTGAGITSSATTPTITVNTGGTYSLAVTNTLSSCTSSITVFVPTNTTAPSPTATNSTTLTCTTTTAVLTGGPSSGVSYQWSGPSLSGATTNSTAIASGPGTYTLKVTDAVNGCTNTAVTSLTQNITPPIPTATNASTLTCTTTTAVLTGGPSSGVTYQWSGPNLTGVTTNSTAIANGPGTYTLKVTDAVNGCTNTAVTTLTQNITPPSPTATNSVILTCNTTTVTLTGGPASGVTYQWNGPGLIGATTNSIAIAGGPGTYSLLVTNSTNGCTNTAVTTVTQNITPPSPTATTGGTLNCTVTTVSLTGTPSVGVNYQWSGPSLTGTTTNSIVTANGPGTYTLLVTSAANGCTNTATTNLITDYTAPNTTASNSTTLTCSTLSTTIIGGPTTGVSYQWSGPSISGSSTGQNVVVNGPGTYVLLATDLVTGCSNSAQSIIAQDITPPTATASNSTILTCTTTTGVLTGGSGGTYVWSGPGIIAGGATSSPTVNAPGNYTVTVTAANGCTATAVTTVTQNITPPTATASNSTILTCTTTTGVLTGGNGGTYVWSGSGIIAGGATSSPTVNAPGNYTVTVTAANGCTAVATTSVSQNITVPGITMPGNQVITCVSPTVSLIGSANPTTCIPVWTGGVSSGANSFTATAASANVYTLTVTNPANGCFASGTVSVTPSAGFPNLSVPVVSNSITCATTTAQAVVTSTTSNVTYSWTGPGITSGATTPTITVNISGTYSLAVTNTLSMCTSSTTAFVPLDNTPPAVSINAPAVLTCSTTSISLTANPSSGPYTYTWTSAPGLSGPSVPTPTITSSGTYSVEITNTVNGCIGSASVSVTSNTVPPTFTLGTPSSVSLTCASPGVNLSGTSNSDPNSVYTWTTPSSGTLTGNPITVSTAGIYSVSVTNIVNGCNSSSVSQTTVEVISDAATPSTTLTSNTETITCSNPTPTVNIAVSTNSVSYAWTPTSGIVAGTENTATPSFNAIGSYSVVVTNTATGCATSISGNVVTITENTVVPTMTLSSSGNSGILTCTTTAISITPVITPTANLTYSWSPGAGISTPLNQANATFTATGSYTLAITNALSGCTSTIDATSIFTVTDNTVAPTFSLGTATSVSMTCASPSVSLSGTSSSNPNSVYTWTTPSSGTLTGNPITVSTAGIYSVSVTNTVNGCSSSSVSQATVEVIADAGIPTTTLTSTTETITCTNPTPTVNIAVSTNSVSYSWTPTSGIVSGTENTATPSFSAAGSYSVVVENTTSGCASSINSNVVTVTEDNIAPSITFTTATNSGIITCTDPSVTVTPTIIPSNNPNLTYTWSPSTGMATSPNLATATFTAIGVYTLAVTNTLTGCVSTLTTSANSFTVTDNLNTPTITATPISSNTVIGCGGSAASVTFSANVTSAGTVTYSWSTGATTPTVDVTAAGSYSLEVTDDASGCSTNFPFTVTGNTIAPQGVSAGTSISMACGSPTVALTGTSTTSNVSYTWAGPSATSINTGSNTANAEVNETGIYTLTVTDILTGCETTATVNVSHANVTAAFTADPTTGISPLTVNFTDASIGANSWTWNFGDSNGSIAQSPSNVYTTGSYTVTLTASSGSCTGTATLVIVIEDGFSMEIPNVFTPNGDNANDVFSIKSTGVKEISLLIFNRWGEKMYEFSGPKASWDGLAPNGLQVPEGTYFYFVKATGFDDTEIEKNGTVNLFR